MFRDFNQIMSTFIWQSNRFDIGYGLEEIYQRENSAPHAVSYNLEILIKIDCIFEKNVIFMSNRQIIVIMALECK